MLTFVIYTHIQPVVTLKVPYTFRTHLCLDIETKVWSHSHTDCGVLSHSNLIVQSQSQLIFVRSLFFFMYTVHMSKVRNIFKCKKECIYAYN